MITKICQTCSQPFKTWPCRVGKYCSHACSAAGTLNSPFIPNHPDYVPSEARKRQGQKMRQYVGEKCWNWKGDYSMSKRQKHFRIQKLKGKPKVCEHCGEKASEWANKDHKYSLNPEDYIGLCRRCHTIYDLKMGFRKLSPRFFLRGRVLDRS